MNENTKKDMPATTKSKNQLPPKHRVSLLIARVPKHTVKVINELKALGINKSKISRWNLNDRCFISLVDCIKLRDYFKDYPELEINTVEDLFESESTEKFAKKKGFLKNN